MLLLYNTPLYQCRLYYIILYITYYFCPLYIQCILLLNLYFYDFIIIFFPHKIRGLYDPILVHNKPNIIIIIRGMINSLCFLLYLLYFFLFVLFIRVSYLIRYICTYSLPLTLSHIPISFVHIINY